MAGLAESRRGSGLDGDMVAQVERVAAGAANIALLSGLDGRMIAQMEGGGQRGREESG